MDNKLQVRLPMLLAATLAVGMFIGQKLPHSDKMYKLGGTRAGSAMDEVLRYVDAKYVDTVDMERLQKTALDNMLDGLDPHTNYISPDELQAVNDDMSGGFEGIGIEFIMIDDTMNVVAPLPGGPAEAVGLMAGDKIISIDGNEIAGKKMDNGAIYKKLRGNKGSVVKLGILRPRELLVRLFDITRDVIPVHSVEVAYMLDGQTGYIKIARFTNKTYQEFMEALAPMVEKEHLANLVLDLRDNPGGYLEEATQMLSQFFPEGKLLVFTEGRTEEKKEYKSNGRARFTIDNIAVLIDEGSASASEIVAGAIQDWDRGWVIGRRSYGKGLVQEQYPLSNGGGLRLTVSRYYTPSGRSIQRDYKNTKEYDHEAEKRGLNGELTDASKGKLQDSTKYYTGLGRLVYGSGGISPDIFIPLDTSYSSVFFASVRAQIPIFMSRWMDGKDKASFPTDKDAFVQKYEVSDAHLEALVAFAQSKKIKIESNQLDKCKAELKLLLKARLAKILFGDAYFFRVVNNDDTAIEKALSVIKSGQKLK